MDKQIYLSELYDIYGSLLTEKQQQNFEQYYFDNLTLSELSENNEVSRNAIHKSLKESIDKLIFYEEKLHIHKKNQIWINFSHKHPDLAGEIEKILE